MFVLVLLVMAGGCARAAPSQPTETMPVFTQTQTLTQTYTQTVQEATGEPALPTEVLETPTPVVWIATEAEPTPVTSFTPVKTFTPTKRPSRTLRPTDGPTPRWTRTFTPTPTTTKTPGPSDAVLRIARPGLYSRITSPYKIEAMVSKGEDGFVYLTLTGEDQRVLFEQDLDYRNSQYSRFLIVPRIEFSIAAVAETARLTLFTVDRFERVNALSSVDIILLSIGDNDTNPAQRLYESFDISSPRRGSTVQGGRLILSGKAAPFNENPIIVEIIGENGEVLSSREITIPMPTGDMTHTPFAVEIQYAVAGETAALIRMKQESDSRLPGVISLSSVAVTLYP